MPAQAPACSVELEPRALFIGGALSFRPLPNVTWMEDEGNVQLADARHEIVGCYAALHGMVVFRTNDQPGTSMDQAADEMLRALTTAGVSLLATGPWDAPDPNWRTMRLEVSIPKLGDDAAFLSVTRHADHLVVMFAYAPQRDLDILAPALRASADSIRSRPLDDGDCQPPAARSAASAARMAASRPALSWRTI